MKKLIYLIVLALILGLVLTGCLLSNVGQVPTSEQSGITYLTKGTEADPDIFTLYAGQHIDVGNVEVWNDTENLYVKYVITDLDWCITETHLQVATSLAGIPQKNGNPIPGQFDHKRNYDPCVQNDTYIIPMSLVPGDSLYIAAHAVVNDAPKGEANGIIYATRISGGTKGLYEIDVVNTTVTLLKEITGTAVNNGTGYTNGLAYDPFSHKLYFTAPPRVNVSPSPLWSYDITEDQLEKLCDLPGSIVGASFYEGFYHYIAEGINELIRVEFNGGCALTPICSGFGIASDFTFGDFAISNTGMLYGSTRISPQMFFSLDITDYCIYSEFFGSEALDLQLAYGSNGKLYGTNHGNGKFYEVNEDTGEATELSLVAAGFSDLASGDLFITRTETAWAGEVDFPGKNWATYITYDPAVLIDTVTVVSDGAVYCSSLDLDIGEKYRLEVSGTYEYWPAQLPDAGIADAKYSLRPNGYCNNTGSAAWISGDDLFICYGVRYLELLLDGLPQPWGTFNETHTYSIEYIGTGNTVCFKILDTAYGDNSGSLIVEIYWIP